MGPGRVRAGGALGRRAGYHTICASLARPRILRGQCRRDTEPTAYGIVTDLAEAGYIIKERGGRRNRYHIQDHLPMRDAISRERTIGEVLELLAARQDSSDESSAPASSK